MKLLSCIDGFNSVEGLKRNAANGSIDGSLTASARRVFSAEQCFLKSLVLTESFKGPEFSIDYEDICYDITPGVPAVKSCLSIQDGRNVFLCWSEILTDGDYVIFISHAGAETIRHEFSVFREGYSIFSRGEESQARRVFNTFLGLIAGFLELSDIKKPKVAHNKLVIKHSPKTVITSPERSLIASHTRQPFERVLTHPRYYKDGVVPTDPKLLRRVPVRGCGVNREIKRFKAVEVR